MIGYRDKKQGDYLKILESIRVPELEEYDISKILYNQSYYVFIYSKKYMIFSVIASFAFRKERIFFNLHNNEILLYSEKYTRSDHRGYWEKIKNTFAIKDLIEFEPLTKENVFSCMSIRHIPVKIKRFYKCFKALKKIESRLHRAFFSAQLIWILELIDEVEEKRVNPKVTICFSENGLYESCLIQYFKNKKAITITNQHGQPVFKSHKFDRLAQCQILNFNADYFIAKGIFTKMQFEKAGIDERRIKVFGGFFDKYKREKNEKKRFCVFLDSPSHKAALDSNIELIKMANKISEKMGYKYVIKIHPTDHKSEYVNFIDEKGTFAEEDVKLKNIFNEIDFCIFYASGIYIDSLNYQVKAFQFNVNERFPIVLQEEDIITDIDDFNKKYSHWIHLDYEEQNDYFARIREQYMYTGDFEGNLRRFVKNLIYEEY